jgi:SPASM domain peptide maturase of grasp-with-spasm system
MTINSRLIWKLFSTCHILKGHSRGLIVDIQRGEYYTIPLSMIHFIEQFQNTSIQATLSVFNEDELEIAKEYFNFLNSNELIFECDASLIHNFPPLDTSFNFPAKLSNSVIEIKNIEVSIIHKVLQQLCELLCYNWVIKILCTISEAELDNVLSIANLYEPEDVSLILSNEIKFDIKKLKSKYNFITAIIMSNSKIESDIIDNVTNTRIVHSSENIINCKYCGVVNQFYFTLSLSHYTESLAHNTCLNRKIAIDAEGNIKNCPSMQESFGNIKDTTLEEAINKPGFKKFWNIKKDDIIKCKDCEFRHVCTNI